jgi:AraC-like DNA-binding protein
MTSPRHRVYGVGTVQPDLRWYLAPHSHSFHEIIAVNRGQLLLNAEGKRHVARAGDILFYRAGCVHEERSSPREPVATVFLSFETPDPLAGVPIVAPDRNGRIRRLIEWIGEDERARRGPEMRGTLFAVLLAELRRLGDAGPDPWLADMLEYLRENHARSLTLDALASRGGMSKFAFVRKFKRLSGRTPMEELRLTRLEQARTLLLTTSLPVKAIAAAVGIGDEYQLSKLLRSRFELTPRSLRTAAGRRAKPVVRRADWR